MLIVSIRPVPSVVARSFPLACAPDKHGPMREYEPICYYYIKEHPPYPPPYSSSWISAAPARTVQINPAAATVTVVVAQAGPSLLDRINRKTQWMGLMLISLSLSTWLVS